MSLLIPCAFAHPLVLAPLAKAHRLLLKASFCHLDLEAQDVLSSTGMAGPMGLRLPAAPTVLLATPHLDNH